MDITDSDNMKNPSKAELRKRFRAERSLRDLSESWSFILDSEEFKSAERIASYISYGDEPQTQDLNLAILKSGKQLALPRTLADKSLEWVSWNGRNESLKKNGKTLEPSGPAQSADSIASIDIVIVPTLHATRDGYRLGQGGGSYDRALGGMPAWRIGLVYSGEVTVELLPIEAHDLKLHAIATPDLILRF